MGPQADRFTEEGLHTFLSNEYGVSATSDRMGYRMHGAAIEHRSTADIVSDGMVRGSVQVPAGGEPMVIMADGPTTGGYPKIATVVSADLPLLAQCTPGVGRVRFCETTVGAAQARYRAMMKALRVDDD
jgi:allophanate hydrolase subunit 2